MSVKINPTVKMLPLQDQVIAALASYLPDGTAVTSVYRSAEDQLKTLIRFANKNGYKFENAPTLSDRGSWSPALAYVKKKGIKIAAPGSSQHEKGIAFDLSGPDLKAIHEGVNTAIADGVISVRKIIHEVANHCIHVEVTSVSYGNNITFLQPFEITL